MNNDILATRLHIPTPRPDDVPRPRLLQKLDEGLHNRHRLTLVSAQAGSGKTALLAQWAAALEGRLAWVSLSPQMNEPAEVCPYLAAAFEQASPALGAALGELKSVPATGSGLTEACTRLMANALHELDEPLVLVLDDYHVIENPAVHQMVAGLLEAMPPALHLVVATRSDPPLPIPRLRAHRQLTEVRVRDLRFSHVEAVQFFDESMGLELDEDDVAELVIRTEGWITGLQLFGVSLRSKNDPQQAMREFLGGHRDLVDYLEEEMFTGFDEATRHFLMHTAILERMTAPLCEVVSGQPGAQARLEELELSNLFVVPLDAVREWYRYNQLFAQFLQSKLRQHYQGDAEGFHAIFARAGAWFEEQGLLDEAVHYASAGQDYLRVVRIIEESVARQMETARGYVLLAWMRDLPREVIEQRPILSVLRAWSHLYRGAFEQAARLVRHASGYIDPNDVRPDQAAAYGMLCLLRAFVAERSEDYGRVVELTHIADRYVPPADVNLAGFADWLRGTVAFLQGDIDRAERYFYAGVNLAIASEGALMMASTNIALANVYKMRGDLHGAKNLYDAVREIANRRIVRMLTDADLISPGEEHLYYEWNDLAKAEALARRAIAALTGGEWWAANVDFLTMYKTLALVHFARGNVAGALDVLAQADATRQRVPVFPEWGSEANILRLNFLISQGRLGAARALAEEAAFGTTAPLLRREREQIALARLWVALDKPDAALELLGRLAAAARPAGRMIHLIQIRLLQALALVDPLGDRVPVLNVLGDGLGLAAPGGFVRLFHDEGPRLLDLIEEGLGQGRWSRDAQVQARRVLGRPLESAGAPASQSAQDALTPRENEVLQKVAQGLSNGDIGRELTIAETTVKKHISNIFEKLGVNNRTAAVAEARHRNMLSG
jgi:LuxR family maltose regulon positive regulatory protein